MSDQLQSTVKLAVLEERLTGHERICSERYGEISASFARVHGRLDYIIYGVISILLATIGAVAYDWFSKIGP